MSLWRISLGLLALVASLHVRAAVPIGVFASPTQERFDALAATTYASFTGFSGMAGFSRIGTGGLLLVNNAPAILPPLSLANDMFGRGVNVNIRFQKQYKQFGGYFRVPNAGVVVSVARFDFYRGGLFVATVTRAVNNLSWQWAGWDLGPDGGFDRVEIRGNGALPGYVGMDNLVVR